MPNMFLYDTSKYLNLYEQVIQKTIKHDTKKFINKYIDNKTISRLEYIDILPDLKNLIENTKKIMNEYSYNINYLRFYVEFHKYNINGCHHSEFDWHEDDYGPVNYNVCTMIYYLYKDDTIVGGNLEFKGQEIEIKGNQVILFNGNIQHRATLMNGKGVRKSIVIMFERI